MSGASAGSTEEIGEHDTFWAADVANIKANRRLAAA
jgi:hypothetical protein